MAFARINLAAIHHNYQWAKTLCKGSRVIAMVKAEAYGHGMLRVARSLDQAVDGFGVATVSEACELREEGITNDTIVVLQGPQKEKDWDIAREANIQLMLHSPSQVQTFKDQYKSSDPPIWLKFDTGMHRLGLPLSYKEHLPGLYQLLGKDKLIVASHFACSDEISNEFNQQQLDQMNEMVQNSPYTWSMANSGAVLSMPQAIGPWNRIGYMLYGNSPLSTDHPNAKHLSPAMSLCAPIIALRHLESGESVGYGRRWKVPEGSSTRTIATLSIGYGDGYPRHAPNGTPILIRGKECGLVGSVSMDSLSVDVTDVEGVQEGDLAELWGPSLPVDYVAGHVGTIGYELLTRLPPRLCKIYSNE